jgi:hypothetical protein
VPPIVLRAHAVKKELEETKSLKHKLEGKEADIKVTCILYLQYALRHAFGRGESKP